MPTHTNPTDWLAQALTTRESQGLLRSLWTLPPHATDFVSNDYLGLARCPHLAAHAQSLLAQRGLAPNGSTGSRLLAGNSHWAEELEQQLAEYMGQQAALLFNSGYDANLAIFSALPTRHCTVFYDEHIHASVRDGIRLGLARGVAFRHNSPDDLLARARHSPPRAGGRVFVAVEAVYSMHGDQAPLAALAALCQDQGWYLVVDEAHSVGLLGPRGAGLVASLGLQGAVFATLATFGKAFGAHGAAVLGSASLRQFLLNYARPFIYTTALPPHSLATLAAALARVQAAHPERNTLAQRVAQFTLGLPASLRVPNAQGAIQPVPLPSHTAARAWAEALRNQGIGIRAVLPPTVPIGAQRLRVVLHTHNTPAQVETLLHNLLALAKQQGLA